MRKPQGLIDGMRTPRRADSVPLSFRWPRTFPYGPGEVHPEPSPKSTGGGARETIPAAPARGEGGAAQWVPKECTVVER